MTFTQARYKGVGPQSGYTLGPAGSEPFKVSSITSSASVGTNEVESSVLAAIGNVSSITSSAGVCSTVVESCVLATIGTSPGRNSAKPRRQGRRSDPFRCAQTPGRFRVNGTIQPYFAMIPSSELLRFEGVTHPHKHFGRTARS